MRTVSFAVGLLATIGFSGTSSADTPVPENYGLYAVHEGEMVKLQPNPEGDEFVEGGAPGMFRHVSDVKLPRDGLSFVIYTPSPIQTRGGNITAFLVDRLVGRVHLGFGDDAEWKPYEPVRYRLRKNKGARLQVAPMDKAENMYRLSFVELNDNDSSTGRIAVPIQTQGSPRPTFYDVLLNPNADKDMGRCSVIVESFAPGEDVVSCDKATERWPALEDDIDLVDEAGVGDSPTLGGAIEPQSGNQDQASESQSRDQDDASKLQGRYHDQARSPEPEFELTGLWKGSVDQSGATEYRAIVDINSQREVYITYPELECGGEIHVIEWEQDTLVGREKLIYGKESCVDDGIVVLEKQRNERLHYGWKRTRDGTERASSTLERTGP